MRKVVSAALCFVTLLAVLGGAVFFFPGGLSAMEPVKILVNGREVTFDVSPFLQEGRVLVPVSRIAEALGCGVKWDEKTNAVKITYPAFPQGATGEYRFWRLLAEQAAREAFKYLERRGDLLVLTNAGYVTVGGSSAAPCLDGLIAATGCSPGRGNLLEVHTADSKPLWFFFFEKKSGQGVFVEVDGAKAAGFVASGSDPNAVDSNPAQFFKKVVAENVSAEKLLANPGDWNQKVQMKVFSGLEFNIVAIANLAVKGAPPGLVKAALFHDHLCPGVTSGYLLANYLKKEFPLRSPDESYYVLAVPPWCKDDALQVVLNTTPGKSGMSVIPVNAAARENLKPEAKNLAGIYFRYDSKAKKGDGVVLAFDFAKAQSLSGIDMNKGFPWESRLKSDLWYLDYLDKPELFINVIKKFELKPGEVPDDYAQPGANPLARLDLLQ